MKRDTVIYCLAALALVFSSLQSVACSFDTDCSPGSKSSRRPDMSLARVRGEIPPATIMTRNLTPIHLIRIVQLEKRVHLASNVVPQPLRNGIRHIWRMRPPLKEPASDVSRPLHWNRKSKQIKRTEKGILVQCGKSNTVSASLGCRILARFSLLGATVGLGLVADRALWVEP